MLETKEQKLYFALSIGVVVVLAAITLWKSPDYHFNDQTDYQKQQELARIKAESYKKYLQSIETDPKASQALFKEIITEKDIKKEVEQAFKTDQEISMPQVDAKNLNVLSESGSQAVISYLKDSLSPIISFNQQNKEQNRNLLDADQETLSSLTRQYGWAFEQMSKAGVPKEAVELQKSLIASYIAYGKLLDTSAAYAKGENTEPWADVYQSYAIMNESFKKFSAELSRLVNKYELADAKIAIPLYVLEPGNQKSKFRLIPEAQAIFGLGDVSITVGDIPRLIMDAVKEGLTAAFSKFMGNFLEKLVLKIESNYKIANFLYYSDALVSGQYVNDYLKKYVPNTSDQQIVKKFIPQLACGSNNQALRPIFKAKANEYLGFDPSALDPMDPDYYQKLSSVGSFMASPEGWQIYYDDLARQAENEAQRAVDRELSSSGLKSPRDALGQGIASSINNIISAQRAGISGMLQLGISNASSFVSNFVAQLTQTLVTKFVFSGATSASGSLGVYKEQSTCLAAAQISPVVPISGTQYEPPPAPPTTEDLLNQECAKLPRGCDLPPDTNQPNQQ